MGIDGDRGVGDWREENEGDLLPYLPSAEVVCGGCSAAVAEVEMGLAVVARCRSAAR
jgi:hypothetical protein